MLRTGLCGRSDAGAKVAVAGVEACAVGVGVVKAGGAAALAVAVAVPAALVGAVEGRSVVGVVVGGLRCRG